MLWGLISVLRGLAATSQAHIPGTEATETNLSRVLMSTGLSTAADDGCNAGGMGAAPTMSAQTGRTVARSRGPNRRNTEEPVNAGPRGGPRRSGTEGQLRLARLLQFSLLLRGS